MERKEARYNLLSCRCTGQVSNGTFGNLPPPISICQPCRPGQMPSLPMPRAGAENIHIVYEQKNIANEKSIKLY